MPFNKSDICAIEVHTHYLFVLFVAVPSHVLLNVPDIIKILFYSFQNFNTCVYERLANVRDESKKKIYCILNKLGKVQEENDDDII